MLVLSPIGAAALLDHLTDTADLWVHLYVELHAVTACLGPDDLVEASWPGYAPQLSRTWSPAEVVGHHAQSYADPIVWTRGTGGAPARVYGYYITLGSSGGSLLLAQPADDQAGLVMASSGDSVTVYPSLTIASAYAPLCIVAGGLEVGGIGLPNQ